MIPTVMSWYYSKNGTQLGPVAEEELSAKMQSGEVGASDLIWQEGMSDWKPASQVPTFQGRVSLSAPPFPQGNVQMAQPPVMSPGQYQKIPNYLWQSIVATIMCCLPFGVVGIVYAAKVDGLVAQGDIPGAQAAAKSAKMWTNISVISWVAVAILAILAGAISEA